MTKIIRQHPQGTSQETPPDGDIAARAFRLFDRRARLDEIVLELALPPERVEYLFRTWARLRRMLPLTGETLRTLRAMLCEQQGLTNGAELSAALRSFSERPLRICASCRNGAPEYCRTCIEREATRASRRRRERSKRRKNEPPDDSQDGSPADDVLGLMSRELLFNHLARGGR